MDHQELVTFEEVLEAADRLKGVANPTPILTSRTLNERFECEIYCKAENFQRVGAFKFRGAYNALSVLSPEEKAKGIITFSSGNHAQALALAAKLQGCSLLVIMPSDAPQAKLEATRGYGAEVILYERDEVAREELGAQIIAESGRTLIHPYDNRHVIAGQGTVGKELHEAVPDLDIVLVPVGGGGLMSGTLVSSKAINPSVETYGVEPEAGDDVARSFRT